MARGREAHQARLAAVAALGRDLSRRARSCCEICRDAGTLRIAEVESLYDVPDLERAILVCDRCRDLMDGGVKRSDPQTLRFLTETVWSEVLPAQLSAVRLIRVLAGEGVPWAQESAEALWLDEDIEALL